VLQGAQNHVLGQFGEQLSARSRWFFAPVVPTLAPRAWVEHREIALLIAGGHADEASAAMRAHVARSRLFYLATEDTRLATEDTELPAGVRGA
jgi:DNA-binding FadR family transcriptional regulator